MIRSWIKTGAADVMSRTGMHKVIGSLSGSGNVPVVVNYHRVVEDFASSAATSIPPMLVSRTMLERHLDWLGRRYRFVTLDELGVELQSPKHANRPIAAITFDDGYRDFYDLAFPLLQRKGIPAAVFVVTDLVSTTRVQAHDKLYLLLVKRLGEPTWPPSGFASMLEKLGISLQAMRASTPFRATRMLLEALPLNSIEKVVSALETEVSLPPKAFQSFYSLTWEMLDHLHRAGVTVGSHTRTHVLMTNENPGRILDEVVESRREIESRLGTGIRHFSYPSGLFNTASVNAVAKAGYRYGYTSCTHRDAAHPLLTVPRTLLWENSSLDARGCFSGSVLSCQIHRAFDVVNGCRQRHITREEHGNGRL